METPAMVTVDRLEQGMNLWEEGARMNLIMVAALQLGVGAKGKARKTFEYALSAGQRFREFLLRANEEPFNNTLFGFTTDPRVNYELYMFGQFAESMYMWSRYSRNVYTLSDDLRVILQATSFGGVRWNEVPWPFDSFAVSLEKPVQIAPDMQCDTIIFSCKRDAITKRVTSISFCFVPTSVQSYECWDEQKFRRFFLELERKDLRAVARSQKQLKIRGEKKAEFRYLSFNTEDLVDVPLKKLPQHAHVQAGERVLEYTDEMLGLQMEVARMVASIAFFITTIPPRPAPVGEIRTRNMPPSAIKKNDPRLISKGVNICKLTFRHTLSSEDRDEMEACMARERTGGVCPHWRRTHYRRESGRGNDPLAPRTVLIPAVIVNRRHLPDGNLPGGLLRHTQVKQRDLSGRGAKTILAAHYPKRVMWRPFFYEKFDIHTLHHLPSPH